MAGRFFLTTLLLIFLCNTSWAKVLGTAGATYQIVEPDALEEVEAAAKKVNWQKEYGKLAKQVKTWRPEIATIPHATADNTRTIALKYTLQADIPNPKDMKRPLYPKGYTFNPLDYTMFPEKLLFIDGSSAKQVAYAKEVIDATIILTGGDIQLVGKKLGGRVYYADKKLLKLFEIKAVPSMAVQLGNTFQITEIYVSQNMPKR